MITLPVCGGHGVIVEIEAGAYGAAAGIGYGGVFGIGAGNEDGDFGFLVLPAMAASAKLKILRTWSAGNNVAGTAEDATYLGPEAELVLPLPIPLKLSVGLLTKIAGNEKGMSFVPYTGVGFGF